MKKNCIAIINQKGGSGKTSFAILYALALTSIGKKVLLIDTDPQSGATNTLTDRTNGTGLFDILIEGKAEPLTIDRGGLVFSLLPADHRLDKIYTTIQPYDLERFQDYAEVVIFDTPPTVQGISRAAALASSRVIIPADVSRQTIKPTLYTLAALKEIKRRGEVVLIGKEPEDKHGFIPDLTREFIELLDAAYLGMIPRSITMQKAASENAKWTPARINKILVPFMEVVK